jgi:DNA-binding MarR family transcriptional regulator
MSNPVDDALRLIQQSNGGVRQSDLWKMLSVDSRKCSRIVKKLLDSGAIARHEHREDGINTFLLVATRRPVDPSYLIAGNEIIPCIGCEQECNVVLCHDLLDWMYQLAICDAEEKTVERSSPYPA